MNEPKSIAEKLDAAKTGEEFAGVLGDLFADLERGRDAELEADDGS